LKGIFGCGADEDSTIAMGAIVHEVTRGCTGFLYNVFNGGFQSLAIVLGPNIPGPVYWDVVHFFAKDRVDKFGV
jgi:hypothetical protein